MGLQLSWLERTPDKREVGGSSPLKPTDIERYLIKYKPNGGVAQLGEHLPCKQGVKSSNLSVSTGYRMITYQQLENFIQKRIDRKENFLNIKTSEN